MTTSSMTFLMMFVVGVAVDTYLLDIDVHDFLDNDENIENIAIAMTFLESFLVSFPFVSFRLSRSGKYQLRFDTYRQLNTK